MPNEPKAIRPYDHFAGQKEKQWLPEQLASRPEVSPVEKLVWSRLARYQGPTGEARPKLETLAEELGIAWSVAQRAVAGLAEKKLIKVHLRRGQHRPSLIEFLDHPWVRDSPAGITEVGGGTLIPAGECRDTPQRVSRYPLANVGRSVSGEGEKSKDVTTTRPAEVAASASPKEGEADRLTSRSKSAGTKKAEAATSLPLVAHVASLRKPPHQQTDRPTPGAAATPSAELLSLCQVEPKPSLYELDALVSRRGLQDARTALGVWGKPDWATIASRLGATDVARGAWNTNALIHIEWFWRKLLDHARWTEKQAAEEAQEAKEAAEAKAAAMMAKAKRAAEWEAGAEERARKYEEEAPARAARAAEQARLAVEAQAAEAERIRITKEAEAVAEARRAELRRLAATPSGVGPWSMLDEVRFNEIQAKKGAA